jgi:hypothetical protein
MRLPVRAEDRKKPDHEGHEGKAKRMEGRYCGRMKPAKEAGVIASVGSSGMSSFVSFVSFVVNA